MGQQEGLYGSSLLQSPLAIFGLPMELAVGAMGGPSAEGVDVVGNPHC